MTQEEGARGRDWGSWVCGYLGSRRCHHRPPAHGVQCLRKMTKFRKMRWSNEPTKQIFICVSQKATWPTQQRVSQWRQQPLQPPTNCSYTSRQVNGKRPAIDGYQCGWLMVHVQLHCSLHVNPSMWHTQPAQPQPNRQPRHFPGQLHIDFPMLNTNSHKPRKSLLRLYFHSEHLQCFWTTSPVWVTGALCL